MEFKEYVRVTLVTLGFIALFGLCIWVDVSNNKAANAEGRVIKLAVDSWRCSKFHMQTKLLGPDVAICDEYQRVLLPTY